ncbi:MAG: sensor histidine kinase [Candidatus Hodarchaeales archaeon]|jgi:signal transduction histidine kinase
MDFQKEKENNSNPGDTEKTHIDFLKKYQELEEFVYGLCHDLKTPVTSILGLAEMMEKESQDELSKDSQYYLKRIQENTLTILERINQILIFSQHGAIHKSETITDLNSLVDKSVSNFLPTIKEKKINFIVLEGYLRVKVDINEIINVFDNLIGNSIKYLGDQPEPNITIGVQDITDNYVTVFVNDNGIGIPRDSLSQVFEMFVRAPNVPSEVSGAGIGLARVKKIIDSYGGNVWLESKEGEGTTVYFSLPSYHD